MSFKGLLEKQPSAEMPDFEMRLREIAIEEGVPETAITDTDFALATEMLEATWHEHGDPTKPSYKYYHDGEHPLDVTRRIFQIWQIGRTVLPERFSERGFTRGMWTGAGHEKHKTRGITIPGRDEHESGRWVADKILHAGYSLADCQAVEEAIIATSVRNDHGKITHIYLRQGSRDPLKLVTAWADAGGVFMEGIDALAETGFDLALEHSVTPLETVLDDCEPEKIAELFQYENQYMRDQLAAFPDNVRYYFPDKHERRLLIEALREFEPASKESLSITTKLGNSPELVFQLVESSLEAAREVANNGLGQVLAAKKHMATQLRKLLESQRQG